MNASRRDDVDQPSILPIGEFLGYYTDYVIGFTEVFDIALFMRYRDKRRVRL